MSNEGENVMALAFALADAKERLADCRADLADCRADRARYRSALHRIAAAPQYFEYDNQRWVASADLVDWAKEALR